MSNSYNRFLLVKCLVLGAFTFPTPFLMFFYVFDLTPQLDWFARCMVTLFLLFAGGIVGVMAFHKDHSIDAMKDWLPSSGRK